MSADNWAICPVCENRHNEVLQNLQDKYESVFTGTLQDFRNREAEYKRQQKSLKDLHEESLREDYEIGIYEGKFNIKYHGECACGFKYKFEFIDPEPQKQKY